MKHDFSDSGQEEKTYWKHPGCLIAGREDLYMLSLLLIKKVTISEIQYKKVITFVQTK
jgi:hypothetical protein